jgi:hypothetical protein
VQHQIAIEQDFSYLYLIFKLEFHLLLICFRGLLSFPLNHDAQFIENFDCSILFIKLRLCFPFLFFIEYLAKVDLMLRDLHFTNFKCFM